MVQLSIWKSRYLRVLAQCYGSSAPGTWQPLMEHQWSCVQLVLLDLVDHPPLSPPSSRLRRTFETSWRGPNSFFRGGGIGGGGGVSILFCVSLLDRAFSPCFFSCFFLVVSSPSIMSGAGKSSQTEDDAQGHQNGHQECVRDVASAICL